MSKPVFLSSQWIHLVFVNFEVGPKLLEPYIPTGTELDFFNGKTYVSLVAFLFADLKAMGCVPVFFHRNFEEVNLRFYVVRRERNHVKRGVVFIKEIISKPLVAWTANHLYYENYITMPTLHHLDIGKKYQYRWGTSNVTVNSSGKKLNVKEDSFERWITEHYWGYTKVKPGKAFEYEVKHPVWDLYEVTDHSLNVDCAKSFGEEYKVYMKNAPASVMLAHGSEVTVHWPTVLSI